MEDAINYTKEAFLSTGNLVFLLVTAIVAITAGLLPALPSWLVVVMLTFGVGTELCYLGIRSSQPQFRRRVRGDNRPLQSDIYRHLSRRSQRRYYRLRQFREEIRDNYRQLSYASQGLLDTHLKKMGGLLRSYLDLLHQRERYYELTRRSPEEEVRTSIQTLEEDMADDAEQVRSVKQRRLDVLTKRLKRLRKAREHLAVVGAQLGTIEDVVKYIHEQSWTLQNPDEVTQQLDMLLSEVEETQRSVHEVEEIFSRSTASVDDDLAALDEELNATIEEHRRTSDGGTVSPERTTDPQQSRVRE